MAYSQWKKYILYYVDNEYLSYEDMYVAFRLVSYAQNGIELSKDNVEANIKCPLPTFADSDD